MGVLGHVQLTHKVGSHLDQSRAVSESHREEGMRGIPKEALRVVLSWEGAKHTISVRNHYNV